MWTPPPAVVVAGVHSGVGKTSLAVGLMVALRRRGLRVQPFKVGPDFLDPMHHVAACEGTPSVNLDGWMLGQEGCEVAFRRACERSHADVAVIEGCMGLHDGLDGRSERGSTAEIAKWLSAPVLLVVDAWCLSRSAAAMVLGYKQFDPKISIKGVVFNRVAGEAHASWLREAMDSAPAVAEVAVLGCVPKDQRVELGERHLGLRMPGEEGSLRLEELGNLVATHVAIGQLFPHLVSQEPRAGPECDAVELCRLPPVRIGVARDAAFCFYYEDNLRHLEACGATLVPFSPLADKELPPDVQGLYFGGGYPELHGSKLEGNVQLREQVRVFCEAGGFCWAECGGLMYLAQTLGVRPEDDIAAPKDHRFCMAGVLPFDVDMTKRMVMGYCTARLGPALAALLRLPPELELRCQQFHFSEATVGGEPAEMVDAQGCGLGLRGVRLPAYQVRMERPGASYAPEGVVCRATVASYCHVHLGATPSLAGAIVAAARRGLKVASLLPSGTEALCAIPGGRERLIAISAHCDYPREIVALPRATASLVQTEGCSSEEVEAQVQVLLAQGTTDFHPIDLNWLQEARPGIILTQEACPTCDAEASAVGRAVAAAGLEKERVLEVGSGTATVDGILGLLGRIGEAIGEEASAASVRRHLQHRLESVTHAIGDSARPRVLGLESVCPLVASGQWLPDMRLRAGAVDALRDAPGAMPRRLAWDEVIASDPEVIVISCCGRSAVEAAREAARHLVMLPGFLKLPALRMRPPRLFFVDHALYSRPGPRVVEGIEQLAALIHPGRFPAVSARDALQFCWQEGQEAPTSEDFASRCLPICPSWKEDPISLAVAGAWWPVASFGGPPPRAAHAVLKGPHGHELIICGGEDGTLSDGASSVRVSEIWSASVVEGSALWRREVCSAVSGEAVPTARSNHAAAIWGDMLIVFGGWCEDGSCPLARLEILHLKTLCWTHGSSMGSPPTPRGNPTMVVDRLGSRAIVFGGWNGEKRFSDLHVLDLRTWSWEPVDCVGPAPCARTDHIACVWEGEGMLVHGGSSLDGALGDLWLLHWQGPTSSWRWEELAFDSADLPRPRSSHSAAVVGDALLIAGGHADGVALDDVHLALLRPKCWVSAPPLPCAVCRHGAAVLSQGVAIWGGYDGQKCLDNFWLLPYHAIWSAAREEAMVTTTFTTKFPVEPSCGELKWDASEPLALKDVEAMAAKGEERAVRALVAVRRLTQEKQPAATWAMLHRFANSEGRDQYVDPASGYSVFTASFLKKRPCCGFRCRHCPHGHMNVPKHNCGQQAQTVADDW